MIECKRVPQNSTKLDRPWPTKDFKSSTRLTSLSCQTNSGFNIYQYRSLPSQVVDSRGILGCPNPSQCLNWSPPTHPNHPQWRKIIQLQPSMLPEWLIMYQPKSLQLTSWTRSWCSSLRKAGWLSGYNFLFLLHILSALLTTHIKIHVPLEGNSSSLSEQPPIHHRRWQSSANAPPDPSDSAWWIDNRKRNYGSAVCHTDCKCYCYEEPSREKNRSARTRIKECWS